MIVPNLSGQEVESLLSGQFGQIPGLFMFLHYKPVKKEFVNQGPFANHR